MRIFPWDPDSLQTPGLENIFMAIFIGAICVALIQGSAKLIDNGKAPFGCLGLLIGGVGVLWAIWLFAIGLMA